MKSLPFLLAAVAIVALIGAQVLAASQNESPDPFQPIRDWLTFFLAVFGFGLGTFNLFVGRRAARQHQELEAKRLLDQAWDLLGGRPGTDIIHVKRAVKDHSERVVAKRRIEEAIHIAPNYAKGYKVRGVLLATQDKLAEAEASFREAINIDPNDSPTHNGLGNVLASQGKLHEARASFVQAINLDPDYAMPRCGLAGILMLEGKLAEAEASLRKAIELDSGNVVAHRGLGRSLYEQGNIKEAEVSFREAVKLDPDYSGALEDLNDLLRSQDKPIEST